MHSRSLSLSISLSLSLASCSFSVKIAFQAVQRTRNCSRNFQGTATEKEAQIPYKIIKHIESLTRNTLSPHCCSPNRDRRQKRGIWNCWVAKKKTNKKLQNLRNRQLILFSFLLLRRQRIVNKKSKPELSLDNCYRACLPHIEQSKHQQGEEEETKQENKPTFSSVKSQSETQTNPPTTRLHSSSRKAGIICFLFLLNSWLGSATALWNCIV